MTPSLIASSDPCSSDLNLEIRQLVNPIVDALNVADSKRTDWGWTDMSEVEQLFKDLFKKKSKTSNEALAIFRRFYLGEEIYNGIICNIEERGKIMIPYLNKYQRCYPQEVEDRLNNKDFLGSPEGYSATIESLKKGNTCKWTGEFIPVD